jgi:cell division protein FtsW
MTSRLKHNSSHPFVRWWRSLDFVSLGIILFLMCFGLASVMLASVGVSDVYDLDGNNYYFAKRQIVFVLMALPLILFLSSLSYENVKRFGFFVGVMAFLAIASTLIFGVDVKGASRWVRIFGLSLQPTEFMKPALIIMTASFLSVTEIKKWWRSFFVSMGVLACICGLTISQPDFGTVLMFCMVWAVQVYLSGLPLSWVLWLMMGGVTIVLSAYHFLPHVKSRIERFLDPASGDSYQVDQAREALLSGGLFGRGPGEGMIKHHLPDAHTDFIFAVIAEEFGLLFCMGILLLYAVFILRGFSEILDHKNRFVFLAGFGLLMTLSLQILTNVCVVMNLLPTTGMTLPFISYGGSAMLGTSLTVGMLLAFTRKRGKRIV